MGEFNANKLGLFRDQRGRRHTWLGVDLQQIQIAFGIGRVGGVVEAKVTARDPAASKHAIGRFSPIQSAPGDRRWQVGRQDMTRAAGNVFGIVIVKAAIRRDLGDAMGLPVEYRDGQFAAE